MSLPMRERGLKHSKVIGSDRRHVSLPMRERGLKLVYQLTDLFLLSRSPCGSVD